MANEASRQADIVIPPTQSNTAGTGVTYLTATTTAANAAVPERLFHRRVRLQAHGDKIFVGFGATGAVNVSKAGTGGATFTAGTIDDNGVPIPDGTYIDVRLDPDEHAQISWQANAANSVLAVFPVSEKPTWRR
jgi:hypothetical protein